MRKSLQFLLLTGVVILTISAVPYAACATEQKEEESLSLGEAQKAWSSRNYDTALRIFSDGAEKGNPQSMTALGYMYDTGSGVEEDTETAVRWYRMAVAADEPYAMFILSEVLKRNPGLETHKGERMELLKKAAEKKLPLACSEYYEILKSQDGKKAEAFLKECAGEQPWAMYRLGLELCSDTGETRNRTQGIRLLVKSGEKGEPAGYYQAARLEDAAGKREDAEKYYIKAAEAGYPPAQCELARIEYESGKGEKAVSYLQKAVENGQTSAYLLLGRVYEDGLGVKRDYKKAYEAYRAAADAGDGAGLNELARMTEKGLGTDCDPAKAFDLYAKGAKADNAESILNMGRMEYYGIGTVLNERSGVKKIEQAASLGLPEADAILADMYHTGTYFRKNSSKALTLYKKAVQEGSSRAALSLALILMREAEETQDSGKNDEAFTYLENAAGDGNVAAQYSLACWYASDRFHAPDLVKAVKWYDAAARKGHAAALCAMGMLKIDAVGEKQVDEALAQVRASAEAGYMPAEYALGLLYEQGRLGERDIESAVKHYLAAAEGGDSDAMVRLAGIRSRGEYDTPVNIAEAFKWYLAAAEAGNPVGQCNVASLYMEGKGTAKDDVAAYRWYLVASENGNAQALYNCALMKLQGTGTRRDRRNALKFLESSAEMGYAPAQNLLGTLYSEGREVRHSYEIARRWLTAAATAGYAPAQFNLGILCSYSSLGDASAAIAWFEAAAEQQYPQAAWYLGSAYEEGRGVAVDYLKAREYYKFAGDMGDPRAEESLTRLAKKEKISKSAPEGFKTENITEKEPVKK